MGYYRNLGQLDWLYGMVSTAAADVATSGTVTGDVSKDCSSADFLTDKSAWIACCVKSGTAQLQSVVYNAQANYGANSQAAAAAQNAFDQQKQNVQADCENTAGYYGAGCIDVGQGCGQVGSTVPSWIWLVVAGGGLLALAMIRR